MTTEMTANSIANPPRSATPALELAAALHEAANRLSDPTRPGPNSDSAGERAARVVHQFLTALETGSLEALPDLVCEDVVYRIPGRSRISGVFEGVAGVVAACNIAPRLGSTDLKSELAELIAAPSGDSVGTFHTMTGTLDGRAIEIDIALRFNLRDGRIGAIIEYSADQYLADDLFAPLSMI